MSGAPKGLVIYYGEGDGSKTVGGRGDKSSFTLTKKGGGRLGFSHAEERWWGGGGGGGRHNKFWGSFNTGF